MQELKSVTWKHFLVCQLRKTPFFQLRKLVQKSNEHGLGVSFESLETQYMAGGNPAQVIESMIYAKSAGMVAPFDTMCALDLVLFASKGMQLLELVKRLEKRGVRDLRKVRIPDDIEQAAGGDASR